MAGHANPDITAGIYTHALTGAEARATQGLDRAAGTDRLYGRL